MASSTVTALTTEAQQIAAELTQLEQAHRNDLTNLIAAHRTKRSSLSLELGDLNKALRALRADPVKTSSNASTGKPLSEAHKQKIKDALQRRAAAKAAANGEAHLTLTSPAAHAEQAAEEQSAPAAKKAASKKAVDRA